MSFLVRKSSKTSGYIPQSAGDKFRKPSQGILYEAWVISLCLVLSACGQAVDGHAVAVATAEADITRITEEVTRPAQVSVVPSTRTAAPLKSDSALLQVRDATGSLDSEGLDLFGQSLIAGLNAASFKLVTKRDLVGTTRGAGTLQQSMDETAVASLALAQGFEYVLFADFQHLRQQTTEIGGRPIVNLEARGGLVLFSATQGVRLQTLTERIATRGFDAETLIAKAGQDLAARLAAKAIAWKLPATELRPVAVEIHVKLDGLTLPFLPDPDGSIQLEQVHIHVDGVAVELDGIALGNAPCRVEVWPGLHRLRIARPGVAASEMTVNVTAPARYDLSLTPDSKARSAFNQQISNLEALRQQQREGRQREAIMASQAELLRGLATMFRQSGYRIDRRHIEDPKELSTRSLTPEPRRP